jgi:histidine triad (HIT) family protein
MMSSENLKEDSTKRRTTMSDCIFCKIAGKKIPAKIIYEDDLCLAFEDITPQAPVHTLIIPKKHISTTLEVSEEDSALIGHLVRTAAKIAKDKGIDEKGFRLVMNTNADSGQTVFHIHLHLLGGRAMHWPPG